MVLRNVVKLDYPFELAIKSLQALCDEVVVLVDPTSEDETIARIRKLSPDRIVESAWDMSNHNGHTNCEISVQTKKACAAATGDWIFSLQADEVLHEAEREATIGAVRRADGAGITGLELERLYFYGSLSQYRADWTIWLLRLFKRGHWQPDVDGAMRFDPCGPNKFRGSIAPKIYHYSRVGDPQTIANRVRNLDTFFHAPSRVAPAAKPYDFTTLRKLDTYVVDRRVEIDPAARLLSFPRTKHPKIVLESERFSNA